MLIVNIHSARRLEERRVEGPQPMLDILDADIHVVCQCGGKHRVLHIVHRTPFNRRRNQVCPQQRRVRLAIVNCDHVAVHRLLENEGLTASANMLFHKRMRRVHGHVAQPRRFGVIRHLQTERIISIKYRGISRYFDRYALNLSQLLQRVDTSQTKMVCRNI